MNYLSNVFGTVKAESPILYRIVLILLFGALGSVLGILLDDRMLMGINIWIKPLKFFISTAVYTLTVGFVITFYPYSNLKKHILRNLVSWTLLLEMVIVALQAARGVQSHYNMSSLTDGILFGAMGILILINVLVMVVFAFDTIRLKLLMPKTIQWALCMGWLIIIFGSWVGRQMIDQLAHNVGVPDGGAGLPLLNWSTIAGDLRVAHFFGLHSIQILPLFGLLVHKKLKTKQSLQIVVITIFGLGYAAFIFFTYYQASQGLPFIPLD
ncbi:MAG: hypothetical protein KJO73_11360 [Croceitalea sp.]|nr:hypothetical protein [Croceitalea sp.]